MIFFSCQIPDNFLSLLALKKSSRSSGLAEVEALKLIKQELSEDISLNIKVATIYRCNLLQLTNNARKADRVGLAAEIPYTNGSTIIVNSSLFKKLEKLLLTTKLPYSKAKELSFKKNGALAHLYDNLNFSYKVWITKFKNKIDLSFLNNAALKAHEFDIGSLTSIINHLNSVELRINNEYFLEFKRAIESSDNYKKIIQYRNNVKATKLIHTVLDDSIEATADESSAFDTLSTKNTNDYLEYSLIISQLTRLLKYSSGRFFLKYVLDGRSRIYVYQ
jgi:hypothetical protein